MSRAWPVRWWLFTLSLVVGAPLLLLLAWLFVTELRREQAEARDGALRIARASASRLRTLHVESSALLDRMAARPALRDPASSCDALFAIVDFFPQYANLFLFDRAGNVRCEGHADARDALVSEAAQTWMQHLIRAGHYAAGKPILRFAGGRWLVVLSKDTPAGILTVVQLPELVDRASVREGTVVTIIDANGTVIARSADPERWAGKNVRNTEVANLVLLGKEGRAEAQGIDGTPRQYGYTSLPELGWFIYAGVPASAVLAPIRAAALRGLGLGTLLVLVVAFLALRFARAIQRPIDALARAAAVASDRGFTTGVPIGGPGEVEMLGVAFNEMVSRRAEAEQSLKALSDRLLVVQEEERTRIARELHDDLGQSLTGLKMDVLGLLDKCGDAASPALRDRIVRTLGSTTKAVQRISAELRPSVLDDFGLIAALEFEAGLFEQRTAIECELSLGSDDTQIPPRAATAIYRIVQEALTNVMRHADASRVEIRLRERNGDVVLEVRDDGKGISREQLGDAESLGLIGIRERAVMLGGTAHFEGVEGRGTIVSVRIPKEPS